MTVDESVIDLVLSIFLLLAAPIYVRAKVRIYLALRETGSGLGDQSARHRGRVQLTQKLWPAPLGGEPGSPALAGLPRGGAPL